MAGGYLFRIGVDAWRKQQSGRSCLSLGTGNDDGQGRVAKACKYAVVRLQEAAARGRKSAHCTRAKACGARAVPGS